MFESWELGKFGCGLGDMCLVCAGGLLVKARERFGANREKGQWNVWETDMGCFVIGWPWLWLWGQG